MPIVAIFRRLFRNSWSLRKELAFAVALPATSIMVILIAFPRLGAAQTMDGLYRLLLVMNLLILFSAVLWALLAIQTHRVLLRDSVEPKMIDGIWIGGRQLKYMLKAIVVTIPLILYYVSIGTSGYLWPEWAGSEELRWTASIAINWVILVPCQYMASRISLVLPAAAIDRPMAFRQAWSLTKGNGWRLTAALLAIPAITQFLAIVDYLLLPDTGLLGEIVWLLVSLVSGVLVVGALSYSYEWLTEENKTARPDRAAG